MAVTAVDLRSILTPVRDQARRETCLAFAVTALHEISRAGGAASGEDLAEEALYWGCKQIDGNWTPSTYFQSAEVALLRWGQPIETTWPYDPTRADTTPYHPPVTPGGVGWFRAGLRSVTSTSEEVHQLLEMNTPVAIAGAVI